MICSRMWRSSCAHQLLAELLLALVVGGERVLGEHARAICSRSRSAGRASPRSTETGQIVASWVSRPVEVPVLEDVAGRVLVDHALDDARDLLAGHVAHVAALEDLAAVLVDDARCSFMTSSYSRTRLRIRKFCSSTFFWAFSICLRQHLRLDRLLLAVVVGRAEAVEDLVDPIAGEQADEVVLGGEEEARLARVALAAGAAAQLVVDPPRLVALGAADEQAAGLADLLALGLARAPRAPGSIAFSSSS